MTFAELILAVQDIVQNDSRLSIITGEKIAAMLNRATLEIAGGMSSVLGSWITPPLPALFTIGTINTAVDSSFVSMPDDFHRNLQFVSSSTKTEIDLADSFISFSETYPLLNKSGSITECIEFGNNFYYQGIPTTIESVTLHYYRKPIDMVADTDLPDGLPIHLHNGLLVNYVCWQIFDLMKDLSMENFEQVTKPFKDRFYENLQILELSIPYENRELSLK